MNTIELEFVEIIQNMSEQELENCKNEIISLLSLSEHKQPAVQATSA
jgi:hypothetical protein